MAKSVASCVNRTLILLAALVVLGAGATALLVSRDSAPHSTDDAAINSAGDVELVRAPSTNGSWFHTNANVENFDFQMKDMTCPAMRPFLTLDLCAVGSSEHGAFMVTAAEGYWDDQDRYPEVPLDFTVYVHTKRNGPARVMSVVSGSFTVPYYGGYTDTISIHSLRLAHQDVVALFYSAKASDENESDDSLQLIAMSATGSPEVIAVYEGKNLTFGSMNNSIVVATSRNGVTSAGWATVTTLSQSQQGDWQESITSQRRDSLALNGAVEPVAIDKYTFPSPDTATGNDTATNA